jgi:DNA (cytosine-5)-methyltransferase 1
MGRFRYKRRRRDPDLIVLDESESESETNPNDPRDRVIIDIEELEEKLEDEIFQAPPKKLQNSIIERNSLIVPPLTEIRETLWEGSRLRADTTVECLDGSFLHIKGIVKNLQTDAITLRGWELRRTRDSRGLLPKKLNELYYIFQVDLDDKRELREQSVVEMDLSRLRKMRKLIRTNQPFPTHSFRSTYSAENEKYIEDNENYIEDNEVLVVRWKYVTTYENAKARVTNSGSSRNYHSRQMVMLSRDECDGPDFSIPPYAQRFAWRGDLAPESREMKRSRNPHPATKDTVIIDISDDGDEKESKQTQRKASVAGQAKINISANDFNEVNSRKFVEIIRRRFEAALMLQENKLPQNPTLSTAVTQKRTSGSTQKYTYGDACKWSMIPRGLYVANVP